ncbi:adenylate/guanylate cyclase domain-containing protein [Mycobacterium paraffinicum]|uniref:Adenylate/guanylate cyclase domain-containing protein n=1 Tax=Mycobacterium paraffinicum TaxID=53378 RepID=A0A1Q4HQY2_9MYCO|nr:adenylate/guanylate cyclase domain-containing protein [Mycobacterium paraffinicum]OJZ70394.1 adenylate/guanylate cyclase domain-containing protein [Mycobacterium paraffinicum]
MTTDTPDAPSGVVTFLFTDIEGSTRRWEADPDGMRAALAVHDQLFRETVAAHRGWLFKHTGDGVCAVFSSPKAAVDAAVAAQRGLQLPVRMGIATGEAEMRGDDYFGAVLNRAARVMSAGHGGQILLDGATAELLTGVDLVDLGPRRLRDIAKPVAIHQVRAPGLSRDFPPLRAVDAVPGNLKAPATTIIGRESDIVEVQTALKAHRLVTLTGVGGVGKTRLALEVASRLANDFADGAFLIELATIGDPAAVPDAAAAVLGIIQQPEMSLADSIAMALAGRSRLLVFDNCEHVLDAAAELIEKILEHSATVTILATSREGMSLGDEQLWTVPSLDHGRGLASPAATLFIERAQGFARGVSLTRGDDAAAVIEICRRLDGIPLAIELAASRMVSMSPTELRDRLDDRFRLLVGSRRGLERHQTLRHMVQWSYDLLHDSEKALLQRCSVFAGGFGLPAACAVTGSGDDLTTLDLLHALVRKSLLVADRSASRTRFSMLETVRQFAEEQLVAAGEAHDTRNAHARYFAGRENDVMRLWDSARQRESYIWFTDELPNLRSAFRWAADAVDLDTAIAIAWYATVLGLCVEQYEPVQWAEELIESAKAVDHPRLAHLYLAAVQCYANGRIEDYFRYSEAGKAAIISGRYDEIAEALEPMLGVGNIVAGHPERWVDWCRNIIERRPHPHTFVHACLVYALIISGETAAAIAASQQLPAAAETSDNPNVRSQALLAYGYANSDAEPTQAYDALARGLTIARESGNRQQESHQTLILSRLAVSQGNPADALDLLTVSMRNFFDSGSFALVRSPLAVLAAYLDRLGHLAPAATISGFAATPLTSHAFPEINSAVAHLRAALGDREYESLAAKGAAMTIAEMVNYALDQIDRIRAEPAASENA